MHPGIPNRPRLARVPGVELFAAGTRGGKEFTPADLDAMAHNARRWGHLVQPTVKLGHGELQALARQLVPRPMGEQEAADELTGNPRLGGVDWRTVATRWARCKVCQGTGAADGQKCPDCKGRGQVYLLQGDLHELPTRLADLIRSRHFNRVSAEVYDRPPEGVPGTGKTLRSISLLGGTQPVVKSLADLPEPVEDSRPLPPASVRMSEVRRLGEGHYEVFSEVEPMHNRAAMYADLEKKGYGRPLLDEMPDHHLAEMCRRHGERDLPDLDGDPPEPDEQNRATFAERYKKMLSFATKGLVKHGESAPADVVNLLTSKGKPTMSQTAQQFSEEAVQKIVDAAVAKVTQEFAGIQKEVGDFKDQTKRAALQKFCENLSAQGKIAPAELDATAGLPTLVDDLMRLSETPVHKFSEGGKEVMLSDLDVARRRLEARPAFRMGEKVRSDPSTTDPDAEKAKLGAHWDKFSEDYTRAATPKKDFLEAFDLERKNNPKLTAEEHLGRRLD